MTDTFTLTGRILDKGKTPIARASLVLASNTKVVSDPTTNEVYSPTPRITTDDQGYLCVADATGAPSQTPGVSLIVGVQYRLRSTNAGLLNPLVFTAPATGETLDLADVAPENPSPDQTWTVALADLTARVVVLEGSSDGSGPGGPVDWDEITDKPTTFPPSTHQHPATQITGLATVATTGTYADLTGKPAISNVDNTSDLNKPLSIATTAALASKADLVAGQVPTSQIPALALTSGQAVSNRAAMLALTNVQPGDFVSITSGADKGTYILKDADPSLFGSWLPLSVPTDVVQSVNGQNGAVVLSATDVGAATPTDVSTASTGDRARANHTGTQPSTTITGLGNSATRNVGTSTGTVAAGDDTRLTDARTPTAHKASHATGGTDAIAPADIGAATAPGAWQNVTIGSGVGGSTFSGCDDYAARLDGDVVVLRGARTNMAATAGTLTGGSSPVVTPPATPLFTVPVSLQPTKRRIFRAAGSTASAALTFVIETNGQVWTNVGIAAGAVVHLDGASYSM